VFKGTIIEFPGFISISDNCVSENSFFFKEGERIIQLENISKFRSVFEHENLESFCLGEEGLWSQYSILNGSRKVGSTTEYIDVWRKGKGYERNEIPAATGIFHGISYICSYCDFKSREDILFLKNLHTKEIKSKSRELSVLLTDGEYIFARSVRGELACYDFDLSPVWSKAHIKDNYSRANVSPVLFNDLIIMNTGVDKDTRKNCELVAYSKANGELSWNKLFENEIVAKLVGDLIYIACNGRMIILDAKTGHTLIDESSGYENKNINDVLWSDNQFLFYINYLESEIRIFSKDGKKLTQELKIPAPYFLFGGNSFIKFNGRYYLALTIMDQCLKGSAYGLLIIEPAESNDILEIACAKRPDYRVLTSKTESDKEEYHIIISEENIADIIRIGEIIIKEYTQIHGSQMWSDERQNKKFNGKIYFSAEPANLAEESKKMISKMTTRTENWLKSMGVQAGNEKNPIQIEFLPNHRTQLE